MQEPLTLYKLMILYALSLSGTSVKKTLISNCIIDQNYTDYLTVQTAIGELTEGGFIASETVGNATFLFLTAEGRNALSLFTGNLNEEIRKDLENYLKEHRMEINNSSSVLSNYKRSLNGEYEATLTAKDRGNTLVEIRMQVPTEDIASNICNNWQKDNAEIYRYLTEKLF